MLKLIADSGSTKTDWTLLFTASRLAPTEVIAAFKTQGTFPRARLVDTKVLDNGPLLQHISVYFYGSGCTPAHVPMMQQILKEVLSPKSVEVYSDLMAAARALCGHEAGIACILGTGANSCLYDGEQIVQNTPALGYILGDEGSGSVLGRLFMNGIFKNPRLADIRDQYLAETKMTQADIIKKVYREPMANRFLASTSTFIISHLDNPIIHQLVVDNFRQFFRSNIEPYGHKDLPVHFVGSMSFHYHSQLEEAAQKEGYVIGQTMQSPMEGLIAFHG